MGGSSAVKSTTETKNSPDPRVTERADKLMTGFLDYAMPDGSPREYPEFDYSRDHQMGAEQVAPLNAFHNKAVNTVDGAPGYEANYSNAQALGGPNYYRSNLPVEQTHVGAFSTEDIARFQNPHTDMVVDQGLDDLTTQFKKQLRDAGHSADAAGAFGGSRQALLEGEFARNFGDSASRFVTGAREQGYKDAVAARQAEIGNNLAIDSHGLTINRAQNDETQRAFEDELKLAEQGNVLASQQAQLQNQTGDLLRGVDQKTRDAANAELRRQWEYPINIAMQAMAANSGNAAAFPSSGVSTSTQTGGPGKGSQIMGAGISALGSSAGSWMPALAALSDVTAKEEIRDDVDPEQSLGAFAELPVSSWAYTDEAQERLGVDDERHVGPMAQDIEELFGEEAAPTLASGDKGIDVTSMLGHIASAIKGLEVRTRGLKSGQGEEATA